jgi:hypothetical protein
MCDSNLVLNEDKDLVCDLKEKKKKTTVGVLDRQPTKGSTRGR